MVNPSLNSHTPGNADNYTTDSYDAIVADYMATVQEITNKFEKTLEESCRNLQESAESMKELLKGIDTTSASSVASAMEQQKTSMPYETDPNPFPKGKGSSPTRLFES